MRESLGVEFVGAMAIMERLCDRLAKKLLIVVIFLISTVSAAASLEGKEPPSLIFLGGVGEIGGSAYLLDTGRERILVDCGAALREAKREGGEKFPVDPATIDYVLITHAHVDHVGRLPLLAAGGFRGRILGTDATGELLKIILKRTFTEGGAPVGISVDELPTFLMERYEAVPYDREVALGPRISLIMRHAGHILGSAIIVLTLQADNGERLTVVFSGDLGGGYHPFLRPPAGVRQADYVLAESTYGAVKRRPPCHEEFGHLIADTVAAGGSVLIPAFTLDRTQQILFVLGRLKEEGRLPARLPVYADSGTAEAITKVYARYSCYFRDEVKKALHIRRNPFHFPGLKWVTPAGAAAAYKRGKPAVYVTSGGMADHGNAPAHLMRMVENAKDLIILVGWQAPGSLGAALQEGRRRVKVPVMENVQGYEEKDVRMRVACITDFSGHGDGCGILTWLAGIDGVRRVFVVHGAMENSAAMAEVIETHLGIPAEVPPISRRAFLDCQDPPQRPRDGDPCRGLREEKHLSREVMAP